MTPDFFQTIAGQRFCANIASIAQSLRVIADDIKNRSEVKEEKKNEHR
jgi:hypothetical protein